MRTHLRWKGKLTFGLRTFAGKCFEPEAWEAELETEQILWTLQSLRKNCVFFVKKLASLFYSFNTLHGIKWIKPLGGLSWSTVEFTFWGSAERERLTNFVNRNWWIRATITDRWLNSSARFLIRFQFAQKFTGWFFWTITTGPLFVWARLNYTFTTLVTLLVTPLVTTFYKILHDYRVGLK